jgi:hypothetical protein
MAENDESCVKPSKGPIDLPKEMVNSNQKEGVKMIARVGKPAPDFEASAYVDGGFKNIRLSDYRGQWVVICFYPGDFTFV